MTVIIIMLGVIIVSLVIVIVILSKIIKRLSRLITIIITARQEGVSLSLQMQAMTTAIRNKEQEKHKSEINSLMAKGIKK